ncbi:unnamed protein product [Protopolystoma xenopodis]|uniref:Uncharacterized protein n=1 Tax=Protopolystoma xenopodis TaxID=117903 RepID=A0A3S5ALY2_9PLAT|nr:unnamed protein product [Protopolystoma xenopodis]
MQLWDLEKRVCTKTLLTTSACQDVVACPLLGLVISGHYDRRLRIWHHKEDLNHDEICFPGRVTGLDISVGKPLFSSFLLLLFTA